MKAPIAAADWPRLLDLVEQALDVPQLQREFWLRRLHLPEALNTALRDLLHERAALEGDDFLTQLPSFIDPAHGVGPGAYDAGALVGPWRLLRPLGQGGMSVVWLAERADGQIERLVAVKLPHAGPGQDVLARRLLRERKILAALAHPNIARLYDVGLTDDGTPFLVMEYVPGSSLLAYADTRRLGLAQRVALFGQVLQAVQYAHAQLVLHRDLKPSNVLVTDEGEVKLLDFGIAKVLRPDTGARDETEPTRAGSRHLTPGYASPEQLAGENLSTASDVYSLGVMLYELLCGRRPLETGSRIDDVKAPSRHAFTDEQTDCRASAARTLARQLRGDLDAIVLQALAARPAQRYASVDAFAADIARWRGGEAVLARAPGPLYQLGKFVKRHRAVVGAGCVSALLLLAASTTALLQGRAAQQEASRATAARDFMLELFAEAAPRRNRGEQLSASQVLAHGRERAITQLQAQPLLRAEVLAGIGETQMQMRDMDAAVTTLDEAARLFRQLGRPAEEASARLFALESVSIEERVDQMRQRIADLQPLLPAVHADATLQLRWMHAQAWHVGYGLQDEAAGNAILMQIVQQAQMNHAAQAKLAFDAHLRLAVNAAGRQDRELAQSHLKAAAEVPSDGVLNTPDEKTVALAFTRAKIQAIEGSYVGLLGWLPEAITACGRSFGVDSPSCSELQRMQLWGLLRMGQAPQALEQAAALDHVLSKSKDRAIRFHTAYVRVRVLAANAIDDPSQLPVTVLHRMLAREADESLGPDLSIPAHAALALMHLHAGELGKAELWLDLARPVVTSLKPGEFVGQLRMLNLVQGLAAQARSEHAKALQLMGSHCEATPQEPLKPTLASLDCVRSLMALGQHAQAKALTQQVLPLLERQLGNEAPHTLRARLLLQMLETPGRYRPGAWDGRLIFFS
jgi:serine/threonine protein kinase